MMRSAVLLAAISALLLLLGAGPGRDISKGFGLRTAWAWTADGGELTVRILQVSEYACQAHVDRLLVESPAGDRSVLDLRFVPAAGLTTLRLLDDASGWAAELRDESGLKVRLFSADQYGDGLFWQRKMFLEDDHPLARTLVVPGVPPFSLSSTLHDPSFDKAFYARLRAGRDIAHLTAAMPPSLVRIVFLLDSMLQSREGDGLVIPFRGLISPLSSALADSPDLPLTDPYTAAAWRSASATAHDGTRIDAGDPDLAFARRFRSLADPADPLSGAHPARGGCAPAPSKR